MREIRHYFGYPYT